MTDEHDGDAECAKFVTECMAITREALKDMPDVLRQLGESVPYEILRECKSEEEVEDRLARGFIKCMRKMGYYKTKLEVRLAVSFLYSFMHSYKRTLMVLMRIREKEVVDGAKGVEPKVANSGHAE